MVEVSIEMVVDHSYIVATVKYSILGLALRKWIEQCALAPPAVMTVQIALWKMIKNRKASSKVHNGNAMMQVELLNNLSSCLLHDGMIGIILWMTQALLSFLGLFLKIPRLRDFPSNPHGSQCPRCSLLDDRLDLTGV
jgi:hypothetical protein